MTLDFSTQQTHGGLQDIFQISGVRAADREEEAVGRELAQEAGLPWWPQTYVASRSLAIPALPESQAINLILLRGVDLLEPSHGPSTVVNLTQEALASWDVKCQRLRVWQSRAKSSRRLFQWLSWGPMNPLRCFRSGVAADYVEWLRGFLDSGAVTSSVLITGPDWNVSRLFLALRDFSTIPLCDSDAVSIVVPETVQMRGSEWGHCTYYMMDGFRVLNQKGPVFVPPEYVGLIQGDSVLRTVSSHVV
jgi:hypothetical protein